MEFTNFIYANDLKKAVNSKFILLKILKIHYLHLPLFALSNSQK